MHYITTRRKIKDIFVGFLIKSLKVKRIYSMIYLSIKDLVEL